MTGEIDGVALARFELGRLYDVGTSLANYMMASGHAEPILDERPALIVPLEGVSSPLKSTTKVARRSPKSAQPRKRR
jgi:hypothetical protein